MNRIPRKAGGALLLVLALAPGLDAGNHPSRGGAPSASTSKKASRSGIVAEVILGALALTAAADPASGASLALSTQAGAPVPVAPGVGRPAPSDPRGQVPTFQCLNPVLKPSGETSPLRVAYLVDRAVEAYRAACDLEAPQKIQDIGPESWELSCKVKEMSASEFGRARYAADPYRPGAADSAEEDAGTGLAIACETYGIELDQVVCSALARFQKESAESTEDRQAELLDHLLKADFLHRSLRDAQVHARRLQKAAAERLQETTKQAPRLKQEAREHLAKVEGPLQLKMKMAQAKERVLARQGNRLPQERQARQEAAQALDALVEARQAVTDADNAVSDAQWELEVADSFAAKCVNYIGRFTEFVKPILNTMTSELGPGAVVYPLPLVEAASDSAEASADD